MYRCLQYCEVDPRRPSVPRPPAPTDNGTETGDESGISDYTPFKSNAHNSGCIPPPSRCIGSSRRDTDNDVREAAGGKPKRCRARQTAVI